MIQFFLLSGNTPAIKVGNDVDNCGVGDDFSYTHLIINYNYHHKF